MTDIEQFSYSKESSLSEVIAKIEYLINSGIGDIVILSRIIESLKNQNQLYDSDQSYLESLIHVTSTNLSQNYADYPKSHLTESDNFLYHVPSESGFAHVETLESSNEIRARTLRDFALGNLAGVIFPHRGILPRIEPSNSDELKITSIVNKTLSENMPMFEKIISSMIDHKLHNMGLASSSTPNSSNIHVAEENEIISIFSNLDFIKSISYSKFNSKIKLVVVHNESDNLKAFDLIEDVIIALEDKLPEYSIEPWILHESEVHDSFLSKTKILV